MKNLSLFFMAALLLTACKKNANPEVEAVWSSSANFASFANGGYTVYNDVWGSGAGPQTIWANSFSNWGVWANHPNTGGVKSYPNSTKNVNKALSSLGSCTSSFNVTTPAGGAWESTYDIWDNTNANEIMLWMNYTGTSTGGGNVKPISSSYDASGNAVPAFTNVSVGGSTWNVFKGSNGSNAVFSFLRTTKTNGTTVDVKAILNWIKSKGWFGNITLGNVQFGFEITSSSGGLNYTCNSYSVTAS
ncbi:MAG TPA: hypothetical protein VGM41_00950 [Chitinophagaceae bacterium]|jgi:hypothetical protein